MDEKQLNLNQPLLSVRRFSSTAATWKNERTKNGVSSFKPESKSGPLRNPGNVPFVWEHSPGRPKYATRKHGQPNESQPNLPKLPPGRILKPKNHDFETQKRPMVDRLRVDEKITKETSNGDGDYDDEEEYMDALDTLSRGESLSYNCSLSGVSGLEPSRTDRKTRDFMMDRFLPAAKAMAAEVPQHDPKKCPVDRKPRPRDVKKADDTKPQLRYGPNFDYGNDGEDSDDDDDEERGNVHSKVCGLLPRFCLKGSFSLVNPVAGLSVRTRLPTPLTRASSSSASSFSETDNEPARVAIYEHRSMGGSHLAKHENNGNDSSKVPGLGLYNRLQGGGSSVFEQKSSTKVLSSFKELLADKNGVDPKTLMAEKTLYVDTVHKAVEPIPSGTKGFSDEMLGPEKGAEKDGGFTSSEAIDFTKNDERKPKVSRRSVAALPAQPPLPKSPSDSWLWRTLPSLSSKDASRQLNTSSTHPKSDKDI